jgi:N-acetylglucosamine-6-sulfatase
LVEQEDSLYCEFVDNDNYREYYNIASDPWQLSNIFPSLASDKQQAMAERLQQFRECKGVACRQL